MQSSTTQRNARGDVTAELCLSVVLIVVVGDNGVLGSEATGFSNCGLVVEWTEVTPDWPVVVVVMTSGVT